MSGWLHFDKYNNFLTPERKIFVTENTSDHPTHLEQMFNNFLTPERKNFVTENSSDHASHLEQMYNLVKLVSPV
jgi:hypothetical protein